MPFHYEQMGRTTAGDIDIPPDKAQVKGGRNANVTISTSTLWKETNARCSNRKLHADDP